MSDQLLKSFLEAAEREGVTHLKVMPAPIIMELVEAYATDCANGRDCRKSHAALLEAVKVLETRCISAEKGRDLAAMRMQESTSYAIELRERLNRYEPGASMVLNATA